MMLLGGVPNRLQPPLESVGQEWSEAATDQIARIERTSIPKATQVLTRLLGLGGQPWSAIEWPLPSNARTLASCLPMIGAG